MKHAGTGNASRPISCWRLLALAGLPALCLALPSPRASAHPGGHAGYASILIDGAQVRYSLQLSAIALPSALAERMRTGGSGTVPDLAPLLDALRARVHLRNHDEPCAPGPGAVLPPPPEVANLVLVLDYVCPDPVSRLTIRDDLADVLGSDYYSLVRVQWSDGSGQFALRSEAREATVDVGPAQPASRGAGSFFALGIQHILTGFDHILFLLALMLRGGGLWPLIRIITAFTIAHSITLALSVFGVVTLPTGVVEAVIALSIAYVAAENLFLRDAASHRWAVSFVFGLVHGLGFSSALRELGLPHEGLLWSLLDFNLGVEVGQAGLVLAIAPLLLWACRTRWRLRLSTAASAIVLVGGLVLFAGRLLVWEQQSLHLRLLQSGSGCETPDFRSLLPPPAPKCS